MRGREAVSVWSIFKSVTHTHTSREKQNAGGKDVEGKGKKETGE